MLAKLLGDTLGQQPQEAWEPHRGEHMHLGWLVGAVEADPKPPPKSSRSPLPRVSLLTRNGLPRSTIGKGGNGFRVKVPGSVRARRGS